MQLLEFREDTVVKCLGPSTLGSMIDLKPPLFFAPQRQVVTPEKSAPVHFDGYGVSQELGIAGVHGGGSCRHSAVRDSPELRLACDADFRDEVQRAFVGENGICCYRPREAVVPEHGRSHLLDRHTHVLARADDFAHASSRRNR